MGGYLVAGFHLTRTVSKIPMKSQSGSVQDERMNPARVGRQQRYSCASVPRSAWLRCSDSSRLVTRGVLKNQKNNVRIEENSNFNGFDAL